MDTRLRPIQQFIYGQAFADGLKATLAILIPALTGLYTNHLQLGLTVALGSMCASLTDAPGPIKHKKNGILLATLFAFLTALLTALAQHAFWSMLLAVTLVTFFFSMFMVYGNRASAVGNTAILILILTMDKPVASNGILLHAGLIAAGGLFYFILSLFFYTIQPYKIAQRALGECIGAVADYLSVKAAFYHTTVDLQDNYKRLIAQHVVVNEKQDTVREIFFKTRRIVEESTDESRKLVYTFVQTVDLFEDITASYYHYASLRQQYGESGGLELIHASLQRIVNELHNVALSIQSGFSFQPSFDYDDEVRQLKAAIDKISSHDSSLVLRRVVVNIRNLLIDTKNITQYFDPQLRLPKSGVDHSHFITRQPLHPVIVWNNLSMQSAVFRHSLRVCVACVAGYLISRFFNYGQHGYWILLTIAFILKPAFSLTKQRNIERIIGTAIGGVIGFLLLMFIPSSTALFILMVGFMIGAYSFMRINYLAMVVFITPYILILFSFLGTGFQDVITERMLDTLIGCAIALPISYLLFPKWESEQIRSFMVEVLRANAAYLEKIIHALSGKVVSQLDYKIARKNVYLHSANLSAAFQRMVSEPKSKQTSASYVQEFVVLNHLFFSNIATLATATLAKNAKTHAYGLVQVARKAYKKMQESLSALDEQAEPIPDPTIVTDSEAQEENIYIKQQLEFIHKLSIDISKASRNFTGLATTEPPAHTPLAPTR